MWDISQYYGVRLNRLYRINNLPKGGEVEAGTVINLRNRKNKERESDIFQENPGDEAPAMKLEFDEF